jgi:hypothetical protein
MRGWICVFAGLVGCGGGGERSSPDAAIAPDALLFPAWGPAGRHFPPARCASASRSWWRSERLPAPHPRRARRRGGAGAGAARRGEAAGRRPGRRRSGPRAPGSGHAIESPTLRRAADGDYRLDLEGETVTTHGTDWLYLETASSLSRTSARANREADFRSLIDLLPGDRRTGLPAAGDLAALDDGALAAANRELARRVELYVPNQPLEAATVEGKRPDLVTFGSTGCHNHQPDGIYARVDWPLKPFTTRVRRQGTRGTCVAHAILAGVEVRMWRTLGLKFDLSEQELYAVAKGVWAPSGNAFGDGIEPDEVLDELVSRGSRIDAEGRWPYNPSLHRIEDEDEETYTHSCDDYASFCSDTNHQMKLLCAGSGDETVCGYQRPPGVTGEGHDPAQVTGYVSLWNSFEPENSLGSIRAHLNAGHPVVYSFVADSLFQSAADKQPAEDGGGVAPGVVSADGGGATVGGHAVLIVGYLANGQLPPGVAAPEAPGGGYLIAKNSWGCKGDGGTMVLAYEWVIDQAVSAYAVTGVSTTAIAPSATLAIDTSLLDAPGHVNFTVQVNRATTLVEIFRGQGTGTKILTKTLDGGQVETVTAFDGFIDSGQNGIYTYRARVTDQYGNVSLTNQVALQVMIDDTDPQAHLEAESTEVPAPGTVRLRATATDDVGVTRVQFYRGLQLIGEDTSKPYTLSQIVGLDDIGINPYVAIAFDAAGNQKMSNTVTISVASQLTPFIFAFTATPASLPSGGGSATLSWTVAGADAVSISPGIGAVAGQGTATVTVTHGTTYVLSATNAAGTRTASVWIEVPVVVPPIIQSFTATPAALPFGGGTTTLAWNVLGSGVTLAIDQGVGDVTGLTQKVVAATSTATYRLTASNAGGTSTREVTVTVGADTTPPSVSLAASPAVVVAPGSTLLTATVSDAGGVVEVTFLRAGTRIAVDTTPADGFTAAVDLGAADAGSVSFTARARDAAGNASESAPALVTVTLPGPPVIASFAASPGALPAGGGHATLTWSTSNAASVSIDGGIGAVAAQGSRPVAIDETTTFVLTASGPGGTTTASVTVTVAEPTAPVIESFVATPAALPIGGGTATLSWNVLGSGVTLAIDHGVGDDHRAHLDLGVARRDHHLSPDRDGRGRLVVGRGHGGGGERCHAAVGVAGGQPTDGGRARLHGAHRDGQRRRRCGRGSSSFAAAPRSPSTPRPATASPPRSRSPTTTPAP